MALQEQDGKFSNQSAPVDGDKEKMDLATAGGIDQTQLIIEMQRQINELSGKLNQSAPSPGASDPELAKAIQALANNNNQGIINRETGQFYFNNAIAGEYDIDPDDILPQNEWVTFASYTVFDVITSDKRNGRQVPAPLGPILLAYDSTNRIQRGKEVEIVNLCVYTCKSRKELKWLYEHSCFGVTFFDNIKGALSESAKKARKMSSLLVSLRSMGIADLRRMASQNNMEYYNGLSPEDLRAAIASHIADKQEQAEFENQTRVLNENKMDELMLKQPG
jgi:hypothetical protein